MGLGAATPALPVQSIVTAVQYYADSFGFECRHHDSGFAIVNRDDTELHLWEASEDGWRQRPEQELRGRPVSTGAESFIAGTASWTAGPLMLLGVAVLWPKFDATYAGGDLALGSFWPTWVAGAIPAALVVVGYSLAIGDWTRYISPKKYSSAQIMGATVAGGIFGMGGPVLWGAFTASMFADPGAEYVGTLIALSPLWFVVVLLYLGLGSGVAQGTVNMYSTGLDLSSIFPRLQRVPSTSLVAIASYVVVVLGTVSGTIIDNLITVLDLLTIGFVSFVIVVAVGYVNHRGVYDPYALQAFARNEKGGRYWYTGGWNWRALLAFSLATVAGLCGLNTAWYKGPLVDLFGGIGLGFVISAVVASLTYVAFLTFFPEDDDEYASGRSLFKRGQTRAPNVSLPPA